VFSNPFWVLIGQGFGGYYEWYFNLMDEPIRTAPHSIFIILWSKMGLLGLILHCCVFGSFYRQGFSFLQRATDKFQRSIMMILMLAVFQIIVYQVSAGLPLFTWVIMGIGTLLPRLWAQSSTGAPALRSNSSSPRGMPASTERFRPSLAPTARTSRAS
ncbi:MAG: hypothetical protein HZB20_11630, partial [Chloroflexi bacterium]|nr:hypothetical protein [Chloroflexota bacterium]